MENPKLVLPFLNKEHTIDEIRQIFKIVVGPNKRFSDRGNFSRWIKSKFDQTYRKRETWKPCTCKIV